MACIKTCMIGTVLFFSILVSMLSSKMSKKHKDFQAILDGLGGNKKKEYEEIVQNRLYIYLIGLCIGILVAFLVTNYIKMDSKVNKVCLFVSIALIVNVFVYMIYPKKKWILQIIKGEPKAVEAWLEVYKEMRYKKIMGIGIGLVAYYLLGDGLLD